MVITIIKRYDINGAWTHDAEAKIGSYTPVENSMWKIDEVIDVDEMKEYSMSLEEECENLTEQNRLLTLRLTEK